MVNLSNALIVQSVAFSHKGHIPPRYTCEGEDINPPLEISNIPLNTKTLALIMDDPDAPGGSFDHWLVWNISPNTAIAENTNPGVSGTNSFGKIGYGGPCPPTGSHRYYFRVFALNAEIDLPSGKGKQELQHAMKDHILAEGELMAYYQKRKHTVAG
jgi:Raf kinase inhibitor-like YbhB/YbcL family protein